MTIRRSLRVGSYAVCLRDGKILLARWVNPDDPDEKRWTLPGGGVEHGEDPYDAAVREVGEETGYLVEIDELLGISSRVRRHPRANGDEADLHSLRIYYAAHIVSGDLRDEVEGSTDMGAWIELPGVAELYRDPCVDTALELAETRPPAGRASVHLGR